MQHNNSRTHKSIVNVAFTVSYQIFKILSNFVIRTIFIRFLGTNYLGVNSLFTNILSVLSIAELGIGTAVVYSMYKPLAEHDYDKMAQLVQYYKKIYSWIALFVLTVGLCLIPFLDEIINLERPIDHLYFYYILYLIDTVVTYLCYYKTSILTADQQTYITKITAIIFDLIKIILQIIVLMRFKNYTVYLLIQISSSIGQNVVNAYISSKKYPYINKNVGNLKHEEIHSIWQNVIDMFSYKIGGVVLNNTDSILISIIVSTEAVGLYSNYMTPLNAINGLTSGIFIAIQASVGNLSAEKGPKEQYRIFKILNMLSFWVYGICTICLSTLLEDFIIVWLGKDYTLGKSIPYIISTTFYICGVLYPILCYRETVGLFKHTKYIMYFASAINIVLSIILGEYFGIAGILFATIIARLATNVWYEPKKLYEIYFNESPNKYYRNQILNALVIVISIIIVNIIAKFITIKNIYVNFAIKTMIAIAVSTIIFYLYTRRTFEYQYLLSIIKKNRNK